MTESWKMHSGSWKVLEKSWNFIVTKRVGHATNSSITWF